MISGLGANFLCKVGLHLLKMIFNYDNEPVVILSYNLMPLYVNCDDDIKNGVLGQDMRHHLNPYFVVNMQSIWAY